MATRLEDLRDALQSKAAANDEIAKAFKVEETEDGSNGIVVSAEQRDAFRKNLADMDEIKGLIEMQEAQEGHRQFLGEPDERKSLAVAAEAAAKLGNDPAVTSRNVKTIGQAFLGSEQFKALRRSGGYSMAAPWELEGDLQSGMVSYDESKDIYTTLPSDETTVLGFGSTQRDPLVPQGMRTSRVRDLFPVVQTSANLIDYIRVTGYTNAASPVPERTSNAFTAKPQSALEFSFEQAPVRTIAHWEAAHRNVLDDEPQLRALIDNELLYGLRLREDQQILSGAGTSEDLTGILNTTGIQTQALGGDQQADCIRKAATLVMLAYFEPTGVVLHPTDWEQIELLKDSTNRYIITVQVSVGAVKRLWNLPVVDTPAITVGTGLVGAFGLGAQLYDRMQASIRISESHDDWFVRNAVAVLAEERVALAVKRPESFVKCTGI